MKKAAKKQNLTWKYFENGARATAEYIWNSTATAEQIAGVNFDCVLKPSPDYWVLVEVTENETLSKVRSDITKLAVARCALFSKQIYCRCYVVLNEAPTSAMRNAGKDNNVEVMDFHELEAMFINFNLYTTARRGKPFGSSVDPFSGLPDESRYTPVHYVEEPTGTPIQIDRIYNYLQDGVKVVLTGGFGTGKSRCIRELFHRFADDGNPRQTYPLAVNLRDHWGSRHGNQIIRVHFEDFGLSDLADSAVRLFTKSKLVLLLDGFDEMATQGWSDDQSRLRQIRKESLTGVRDLVSSYSGGLIITGREHFFNSDDEMFSCLGLDPKRTKRIRCRNEFSSEEMNDYLQNLSKVVSLPHWLPRRPLICQLISRLDIAQIERSFVDSDGEIEFWEILVDNICKREERIKYALDAKTIKNVYMKIAGLTRFKPGDSGPITISEITRCFENVVGSSPTGEASVILQRLPGLGRISSENNDRQFIDSYILDGLRAEEVIRSIHCGEKDFYSEQWINHLGHFGVRRLADDAAKPSHMKVYYPVLLELISSKNQIALSDLVSAIGLACKGNIGLEGSVIKDLEINILDLSKGCYSHGTFQDCIFSDLIVSSIQPEKLYFKSCLAKNIFGVSSKKGMPSWLTGIEVEHFEEVQNVSQIKNAKLSTPQRILIAIIKKTFFQPGSGRREEALLRGFSGDRDDKVAEKILNKLLRDKILEKARGEDGWLYIPKRHFTKRMEEILNQLTLSKDSLWDFVSKID